MARDSYDESKKKKNTGKSIVNAIKKTVKALAIHYSLLIAFTAALFQQDIGKMAVKSLSTNLPKARILEN